MNLPRSRIFEQRLENFQTIVDDSATENASIVFVYGKDVCLVSHQHLKTKMQKILNRDLKKLNLVKLAFDGSVLSSSQFATEKNDACFKSGQK